MARRRIKFLLGVFLVLSLISGCAVKKLGIPGMPEPANANAQKEGESIGLQFVVAAIPELREARNVELRGMGQAYEFKVAERSTFNNLFARLEREGWNRVGQAHPAITEFTGTLDGRKFVVVSGWFHDSIDNSVRVFLE